ncbi:MAG TPA: hypothetical protein VK524_29975 [Polyangiaceae bacterium]|nr:hypothetical protein [Polyangiaceae bacterium]
MAVHEYEAALALGQRLFEHGDQRGCDRDLVVPVLLGARKVDYLAAQVYVGDAQ